MSGLRLMVGFVLVGAGSLLCWAGERVMGETLEQVMDGFGVPDGYDDEIAHLKEQGW